jgi:hypothetical protein
MIMVLAPDKRAQDAAKRRAAEAAANGEVPVEVEDDSHLDDSHFDEADEVETPMVDTSTTEDATEDITEDTTEQEPATEPAPATEQ